uniref:CW-type domain-containing protein n=1 Tax=Peronospora matthiolae TaxID=2874970 RepID=A0AAV1UFY4_9STRA
MDLRAALNAVDDDYGYDNERPFPVQTEIVDVYLLRPEEPRDIEVKDFTIMKPKKNKMRRLIRFYPRCQISYRATLPAEEKVVTSPGGTVTTTILPERLPRHNGGFSNPSRSLEILRMKKKLLQEYNALLQDDDREAAMFDALIGQSAHSAEQQKSSDPNTSYANRAEIIRLEPLRKFQPPPPKYEPVTVGDEDFIPLTGDKVGSMTLDERVKYVSSLWPSPPPVDDHEGLMDFYGIEVQIISEEERAKEFVAETDTEECIGMQKRGELLVTAASAPASETVSMKTDTDTATPIYDSDSETTVPSSPEYCAKTRRAALQKLKKAVAEDDDDELRPNPMISKQDDWVQCDKCQKWRRLPNQVNVSELPAVWYCKMNRWDKHHNKCSAREEKLVLHRKKNDVAEYLQRKFAQDFVQRCKRLDQSTHLYKYTHAHEDDGERKFVQCSECLKLRPLISGMDPNKVAEPFVCWMNSDELLASCSAPEGPLYSRTKSLRQTVPSRGVNSTSCTLSEFIEQDQFERAKDIDTTSDPATSGCSGRGGNKSGGKRKRRTAFGVFDKGSSAGNVDMMVNNTKRRTAA